jgi:DNA-binding SARP family transcriptional activator
MADFEHSKALYQRAGSLHAAWPLLNLGTVFRERGDLAMARAMLEEALSLAERSEDVQGLIGARSELARILVGDEPAEATRLAESAIEVGRAWGGLVDALVGAGWVALARGQRERAAELGAEAAQQSRTRHHRPSLAEALELQALASADPARELGRLKDALAIWREVENPLGEARVELALARLTSGPESSTLTDRAELRLRALGVRVEAAAGAAGLLAALPREDEPPVAIRTLGGFRVVRHGQPVPASDWQSKKARDLLKILVARRGRPAPREFLMDALWPEEDPERLPKRLSVVLATLRAVLDPDREQSSEHFVAGDDEALWIDRDHVPIDVEGFLAEASAGLALLRRGRVEDACEILSGAEARYTGDFLEEDLYEEWAASLREEARANYIAAARALASAAARWGGHDSAVRYNLRILERDPFDEEAHLGLVSTLVSAGRHGEARRAYRTYVARMEELDVEPAPYPASSRPALEAASAL